jgi:hypothetical protein
VLTVFDLFELVGAFSGLATGVIFGHRWLGWIGVILGGAVGLFAGRILGRLPYAISSEMLRRDLKRCDIANLRSRLDREYFISHLIIAELVVRGEPIESNRDYVSGLLRSDSPDRRRFGERILRLWPETAQPPNNSPASAGTGSHE